MIKARCHRPYVNPINLLISAIGTPSRPGPVLLEVRNEIENVSKDLVTEFRDNIRKNVFDMAPLSPRYKAWKIRKGLDRRILIAQKKYIQAIGYENTPYGVRIGVMKGFRVDKIKKKDGTTQKKVIRYKDLVRWLEYGTTKMPPRPHWRPQMRKWKRNRKEYGMRLKGAIGRTLRRLIK